MSKDDLGRAAQQIVEKAGTEVSYVVGNKTQELLESMEYFSKLGKGAIAVESGRAIGNTAFKATEDAARNDKLCTGICLVATACEVVAGTSALIKYPGALKVYFVAKSISFGCIRFRDLCKNAKGEFKPC